MDAEAFYVPGAIVAGRYRMVALLGKGGMGDVYRAEDLKLGQTVALKFLPASVTGNETVRARFHREVRLARQVSHPNVCRVFDIGEADGRTFLTMEYVDGEDLAFLLRRIGRLPPDKALEIARQICAGLAAAHEHGIIHRDLKPANIMLDGRGRVRITDFGLAGVATELHGEEAGAGTPAYMSPEQFESREATAQSDLYALGLVLYEIFTGKPAFEAPTYLEMMRLREKSAPTFPSQIAKDIDPQIQRLILRCLEKDAARRPASAVQVAAALPGGDPLAAALAAGETPSPEMVAAAGKAGALSPAKAWALLAAVLAAILAVLAIASRGLLINLLPADKSPAALTERAQQIARQLGHAESPADSAHWYDVENAYWPYLSKIPAPARYRDLGNEFPGPLQFLYRQSPRLLEPTFPWHVNSNIPPFFYSGELAISLDVQGRLIGFSAISTDSAAPGDTAVDWSSFLREAGLDPAKARLTPANWYPDVSVDQQMTWDVERNGKSIQVRAGSYRGRPVFFEVRGPWSPPPRTATVALPVAMRFARWTFVATVVGLELCCLFLVRRNLRLGRGDRKGALRVAGFLFGVHFLSIALLTHYGFDRTWVWSWWQTMIGVNAGVGLQFWILYIALEPYIRRSWPEVLISWSRLLEGSVRDPLVGRDMLLGILVGAAFTAVGTLATALPYWFSIKGRTPYIDPLSLGSSLSLIGNIVDHFIDTLMNPVGSLAMILLAWRVTRSKAAAIIILGIFYVTIALVGENLIVDIPLAIVAAVLMIFCLVRIGLLSAVFAWLANSVFLAAPLTLDFTRWYAGWGAGAVLFVLALALYGFHTSLGGRPLLGAAFED